MFHDFPLMVYLQRDNPLYVIDLMLRTHARFEQFPTMGERPQSHHGLPERYFTRNESYSSEIMAQDLWRVSSGGVFMSILLLAEESDGMIGRTPSSWTEPLAP